MELAELQEILQSDKKLTVKEIIEIIHELQKDCFGKICELSEAEIDFKYANKVSDCVETVKPLIEQKFYQGEINAFYICLDLLSKVGEEND